MNTGLVTLALQLALHCLCEMMRLRLGSRAVFLAGICLVEFLGNRYGDISCLTRWMPTMGDRTHGLRLLD